LHDLEEWEIWDAYPQHRLWFNKLYLAYTLGYKCGPGGYPPSSSNYYVVRPIYNLPGMGLGSSLKWIPEGERSSVPPGYFWCEFLSGSHYSTVYKWNGLWVPEVSWVGYNDSSNFTKFSKWERSDYYPPVPKELDVLQDVKYINIEFKGNNPIEVHLRASGNPDGSVSTKYNEFIPVWKEDKLDIDFFEEQGYVFIPNSIDMDDVVSYISNTRLGFLVK
jgi:hypothetical protein